MPSRLTSSTQRRSPSSTCSLTSADQVNINQLSHILHDRCRRCARFPWKSLVVSQALMGWFSCSLYVGRMTDHLCVSALSCVPCMFKVTALTFIYTRGGRRECSETRRRRVRAFRRQRPCTVVSLLEGHLISTSVLRYYDSPGKASTPETENPLRRKTIPEVL